MAPLVKTEDPEDNYEILKQGEELPESYTARYWQIVKRTLDEVFDCKDFVETVDKLKEKVESSALAEKTYFYHAEPLDVASDLAGRTGPDRALTVGEKQAYLNIKGVGDQPSCEQLAQSVPDD